MPRAIEEMLRYDGPVMALFRTAKENLSIGGAEIEKNSGVLVLLGAANRDPLHFEAPDVFDITRTPNEHLAFGDGIHFCLGAPLARLESSIAIGTLLNRFPKLRVQTDEELDVQDLVLLSRLKFFASRRRIGLFDAVCGLRAAALMLSIPLRSGGPQRDD